MPVSSFGRLYNVPKQSQTPDPGVSTWPAGTTDFVTNDEYSNPNLVVDTRESSQYTYQLWAIVTGTGGGVDIWQANDLNNWTKTHDQAYTSAGFTDVILENGTYYGYTGNPAGEFWSGSSVDTMSYTGTSQSLGGNEANFYVENGEWWAVSTEGDWNSSPVSNKNTLWKSDGGQTGTWTLQGDLVSRADTDPWGTGDPYLLKFDGTYYLFADKSDNHPEYYVGLWTSDTLAAGTGNWTYQGQVTETFGGDPRVVRLADESGWLMHNEYANPPNQLLRQRIYQG